MWPIVFDLENAHLKFWKNKNQFVPKLSFQQNFSKILSANKPEWGDIATEFCSDLYEWFALHREDNQLFVN